ncbi:MAG: hypothetical protein PHO33_04450, partial [Clostridia bacterium]|nr:hypothetical protein [Clostridia bacterium]
FGEEIMSMLETLEASVDGSNPDDLRQDVLAAIGIARVCFESGLVGLIASENVDENAIIALLSENDYEVISDILDNLFNSATLKSLLVQGFNLALEEAENQLSELTETEVTLDRVSVASISWTNFKTDILGLITNSLDIYNIVKVYDETTQIEDYDYESILTKAGTLLNIIQDFTILIDTVGGNNIYEQILGELDNSEYAQYVNFSSLADIDWINELEILTNLYLFLNPLIYQVQPDLTFAELDYTSFGDILTSLFNSTLVQSVKFDVFDLLFDEITIEDATLQTILTNIYNNFDIDMNYVYELGDEITNYYDVFALIGRSGIIDAIINDSFSDPSFDYTAILTFFETCDTDETDSRMDKIIGYLMDSESFRIAFVELLNNNFLVEFAEINRTLWQAEKTVDWDGWTEFETELKAIAENLFEILKNVDFSEFSSVDFGNPTEFKPLLLDIINNSADDFGGIFDILATSDFFTYVDGVNTVSIYDALLTKYFNIDLIYIDNAYSENYVAGYWLSEFSKLVDVITLANSIIVDDIENTTLWDTIINSGDLESALTGLSVQNLNDLLAAMLSSDLLKTTSVDIINAVNSNIMLLVNDAYIGEVATVNTDIATDKDNILAVITSVSQLGSMENFDTVADDFTNQKASLVNFLVALQNEYTASGVFSSAYVAITDFLIDSESTDPICEAIVYAINNEPNIGTGISDYDWSAILDAVETYLEA